MDKRTGIRCFTRFFGGTVLLENARPVFDSKVVPEHGDIIIAKNGSTFQVQNVGGKLVEKFIKGPPRGVTLPPNWAFGGFDPEEFRTEL